MEKKMFNRISQFSLFAALLVLNFSCTTSTEETKVQQILESMSLKQKAELVVGTGMYFPMPDSMRAMLPPAFGGEATGDSLYDQMVDRIRTYLPGAAGNSAEFPELGITSQVLADGPAGLRILPTREGDPNTYYCTAFPIGTLLASSWDTQLIEQVGRAMGEEVLEYGADVILGPALNLQRDPLCGRNFEYYSEDPLVTGKMAAAMVKGIQSNGVGTSIKHFAANNQETNRLTVNTIVSERALRELYLKGFEIAVKEGKPWTVMSSYNKINGTYASESYDLLTKVLRDDWGFDGYVMTDWTGGSDRVAQMKAGNDMIQPGSYEYITTLIDAVEKGTLDESVLDTNVKRILSVMMQTPRYKGYEHSSKPDLKAHAQVTYKAATDGMVLLENRDQTLPLPGDVKKVAAFGNTSYDFISGGTGSGDVNEAYTISLIQGLETAGYEINATLRELYETYIRNAKAAHQGPQNMLAALLGGMIPVEEMPLDPAVAKEMAEAMDVALITIGRNAGEGGDREAAEGDFYLTGTEKNLIRDVTQAFHDAGKKAVVILNVAGVVETATWSQIPDAVLCVWQPGQEAGNSVMDVVSGKVNPSGKLAVSFPVLYDDTPTAKNFPGHAVEGEEDETPDGSGFSLMQRTPWEVVYEEDIFVGYRYYNTFDVPVAYEFGYGKSYTSFEYSNLNLDSDRFDKQLTASIDVSNTGDVAGREVVQVYASAPEVRLEKPEEVLVAFGKTGLLEPGQTETLTFTIDASVLSSFDEENSSWLAEAGTYTLKFGASSKDIRGEASFTMEKDITSGTVSRALVPQQEIDRLHK